MVVVVVLVGSYASALNMSVTAVALPAIAADLDSGTTSRVDWVVTAFLTGMVLVQPITSWLADRIGRRRLYIGSLSLFGVGAAICAVAPTIEILIAARIVQGFGGGALFPVGMAMIYDLFPPERRGTALGVWGIAIMAAPAAGPPLGGWLVTVATWRWIFGVFTVVTLAGVLLAWRQLPALGERRASRLDRSGWLLTSAVVVALVIGSRQLAFWDRWVAVVFVVATIAAMVVLVRRSLRRPDPIIEFTMFSNRAFSAAIGVAALLGIAQFAQMTFLPVELQVVRGLDPGRVGLLLMPGALGMAAMMPLSGRLVDAIGPRIPVVVGLVLTGAGTWQLAHLTPDGTSTEVVVIQVILGVGQGLVFIPTSVAALSGLASHLTIQASTVNSLNRQVAGAVGVAVFSAVLVADLGEVAAFSHTIERAQAGYNRVFAMTFVLIVAAAIVALLLPGRTRTAPTK